MLKYITDTSNHVRFVTADDEQVTYKYFTKYWGCRRPNSWIFNKLTRIPSIVQEYNLFLLEDRHHALAAKILGKPSNRQDSSWPEYDDTETIILMDHIIDLALRNNIKVYINDTKIYYRDSQRIIENIENIPWFLES